MNFVRRNSAGIRASTRSFFRDPLNVALVVVLPLLSIQLFGIGYGQFSMLNFLSNTGSIEMTGRLMGATFATGALAGLLGLFQIISAREADRRLAICGYPAVDLLVTRFVTVLVISIIIAGVATGMLVVLLSDAVGSPLYTFTGLAISGVIYGMLGILVGSLLPRELEGSLVLVILADMDNVLASGLFQIDQNITQFSPLSHPYEIVVQAVTEGGLATEQILPSMTFVLVFGVLAVIGYTRTTGAVVNGGGA